MLHARRPPSVYSQDDPLAFALRPPEAETELERRGRLQREADSKRMSDIIDEQLKNDKKNYEKSKQDVRVSFPSCISFLSVISFFHQLLLLGQAESGKSTVQKQFQLMYSPDSLDQERASWRTVVYFNIARSVKRILDILDSHGDLVDDDASDRIDNSAYDPMVSKQTLEVYVHQDAADGSSTHAYSPVISESQKQVATLRLRLSPLVAAESMLADRLSGGIHVSGSGKGSVYVRDGWQSRSFVRNSQSSTRSRGSSTPNYSLPNPSTVTDGANSSSVTLAVEEVGRILDASKEDIKALWRSDIVQRMIKRRKLRLEEWAEL